LVLEKNANFFAEYWQKSQKIVFIKSTPDWAKFRHLGDWANFYQEKSPNDLGEILAEKISPKIHLNKAKLLGQKSHLNIFLFRIA
jgi:hypothetical protein